MSNSALRASLTALWGDGVFRAAVVAFALGVGWLVVLEVLPAPPERGRLYVSILYIILAIAAFEWRRRRAAGRSERRFWALLVMALAAWLFNWAILLVVDPAAVRTPRIGLLRDVVYLGSYVLLAIALELHPERRAESRLDELFRSFHTAAASLFAFGLLIYFVVLPSAANQVEYATRAPSLLLYVALDGYILLRLAVLATRSESPAWRLVYWSLLAASGVWLVNDGGLLLQFLDVTSAVDSLPARLLRWADFVALAAAARAPVVMPKPRQEPQGHVERLNPSAVLWGGPLIAYLVAIPVLHAALGALGLIDPRIEMQRELLLLVMVLGLAVIATVYYILLGKENRRLATQAMHQRRQAQRLETLGQLTAGIAHDLNNLLTVILASASFGKGRLSADHREVRSDIEEIERAGHRAGEMVRRLVAFSRGRREQSFGVDIGAVTTDMCRIVRRLLPANISVHATVGTSTRLTRIDAAGLEQVLLNLIMNARDAMPDGGMIEVTTAEEVLDAARIEELDHGFPGRYSRLTVRDDGSGMSTDTKEHLFDPFFTTKEEGKGAGLGMTMVAELVRLNDGFVIVESDVGEGSTISVYLPLTSEPPEPHVEAPAEAKPAQSGRTILLVEDDESVANVARRALERHGYRVRVAQDGIEAKRCLDEWAPEIGLVLSDLDLPGASGAELLELVRARGHVPFVLTTGYTDRELGDRFRGVSRLHKPWTIPELLKTVERAMG